MKGMKQCTTAASHLIPLTSRTDIPVLGAGTY